jgi:hypothetical protein
MIWHRTALQLSRKRTLNKTGSSYKLSVILVNIYSPERGIRVVKKGKFGSTLNTCNLRVQHSPGSAGTVSVSRVPDQLRLRCGGTANMVSCYVEWCCQGIVVLFHRGCVTMHDVVMLRVMLLLPARGCSLIHGSLDRPVVERASWFHESCFV